MFTLYCFGPIACSVETLWNSTDTEAWITNSSFGIILPPFKFSPQKENHLLCPPTDVQHVLTFAGSLLAAIANIHLFRKKMQAEKSGSFSLFYFPRPPVEAECAASVHFLDPMAATTITSPDWSITRSDLQSLTGTRWALQEEGRPPPTPRTIRRGWWAAVCFRVPL